MKLLSSNRVSLILGLAILSLTAFSCKERGSFLSSDGEPGLEKKYTAGMSHKGVVQGTRNKTYNGWNPCGERSRQSTMDLESMLRDEFYENGGARTAQGAKINNKNAKSILRVSTNYDESDPNAFFSIPIKGVDMNQDGKPDVVRDNMMTYRWSLKDPETNPKASYHNPMKPYNHIIPMRNGYDQPEMLDWVKGGDVVVYWHPETRGYEAGGATPDTINQWRATHAATVMEIPTPENELTEGGEPCRLTTLDTPSGYAKPFDGSDSTPFHVFRWVLRAKDYHGNAEWADNKVDLNSFQVSNYETEAGHYDDQVNFFYRAQIQRYGSTAFDRFDFNGDYGSITVDEVKDLQTFERSFLWQAAREEIPPMYCAWFVWTNVNLAFMRPMTQSGMSDSRWRPMFGDLGPQYADLTTQGRKLGARFSFHNQKQMSHREGEGFFRMDYALPIKRDGIGLLNDVMKRRDEFALKLVTAPELIMNFLDRMIGPDHYVSDQAWPMFAQAKAGILNQLKQQGIAEQFKILSDDRLPPHLRETNSEAYNKNIECRFGQILGMYAAGKGKKEIRDHVFKMVTAERTGNRSLLVGDECAAYTEGYFVHGRKWIPPYGYARMAENYEYYYLPEGVREKYEPRLVYVGSVVNESFLGGGAIQPKKGVVPTEADKKLDDEIRRVLGLGNGNNENNENNNRNNEVDPKNPGSGEQDTPSKPGANPIGGGDGVGVGGNVQSQDLAQLLLEKLIDPGTGANVKGLNQFEVQFLKTVRDSWRGKPTEQAEIAVHNAYGLDPVKFKRVLVAIWNNQKTFREAAYDGAYIEKASKNIGILISDPPEMVSDGKFMNDQPGNIANLGDRPYPRLKKAMKCLSVGDATPSESGGKWACPVQ